MNEARAFGFAFTALRLPPPPSLRSLHYYEDGPPSQRNEIPMHDNETDELPLADRETLPPSGAEAEAAFRESQLPPMATRNPGPRTLVSPDPLEPALAELRGIRGDILAGFQSQGAELATIRHNAQQTNQRLSGLENRLGRFDRDLAAMRKDHAKELAAVKRDLRAALRRITDLEKANLSHGPETSAPPSA